MQEFVQNHPMAFIAVVILLVPPVVVLVLSVGLYLVLLPFICIGSLFGTDPWRENFRFYSIWCLLLLVSPVRRVFAGSR
jgi:hypothetical protein